MKALVTATSYAGELERLAKRMDLVHEDWRKTQKVYFWSDELIERVRTLGADVLVVELPD